MPKFKITAPRYVDGVYVHASPQHPQTIELEKAPDKSRVNEWRGLHAVDEKIESPKPAYAAKTGAHRQSSAEAFGKRASDSEPV